MNEPESSEIRIAVLSAKDGAALAEFFRHAWGASATTEDITTLDVGCPFTEGMPAPAVGIYVGARIVGYLGSIPTQLWDGSRANSAHWLKGFMVLEEFRNGPMGYLLLKQMLQQVSLSAVMTVAPAARRLFSACGFQDQGAVPNYISVIRPERVLRSIDVDKLGLSGIPPALRSVVRAASLPPIAWTLGMGGRLGLAMLDSVSWLRTLGLRARVAKDPPDVAEIDELWQRLRQRLALGPDRSGAYIRWRYAGKESGRYEFIEVRRGDSLAALAVVRRSERVDDRLAGLRLGLVVDLVVDPEDNRAVLAAMLGARGWAHQAQCDAVLLTLSHRGIGRIVKGLGYVKIPGNVHFMLRAPAGALTQAVRAPQDIERSWLTRGDAWGDDI